MERSFHEAGCFKWSIYQYNTSTMKLEIDCKPLQIDNDQLTSLIFRNGKLPRGVTIDWQQRLMYARATISLGQRSSPYALAQVAREPFKTYFVRHIEGLPIGWEQAGRRRREAHSDAFSSRYEELGGRSPNDIIELGQGAYEIEGVGFVWYGSDKKTSGALTIETQEFTPGGNEAMRWFLRRGASLSEARYLNETQQRNLNMQAMAATGIGLGGVAGFSLGTAAPTMADKAIKVLKDVGNRSLDALGGKGKPDLFKAIITKFSTSDAEFRIQQLNNRPEGRLVVLKRLAM